MRGWVGKMKIEKNIRIKKKKKKISEHLKPDETFHSSGASDYLLLLLHRNVPQRILKLWNCEMPCREDGGKGAYFFYSCKIQSSIEWKWRQKVKQKYFLHNEKQLKKYVLFNIKKVITTFKSNFFFRFFYFSRQSQKEPYNILCVYAFVARTYNKQARDMRLRTFAEKYWRP